MKRQTVFRTYRSKVILLKHINKSPGIRYRELQRITGFANGVLAYHLNILEKSKRIKVIRCQIRKSTRYYYPLYTTAKESSLMEYVRRTTTRKILLCLLKHDQSTSDTIMQYTKKVRSTISWHLSWLQKAGIVSVTSGMHKTYTLRNKDQVAVLMNKTDNQTYT